MGLVSLAHSHSHSSSSFSLGQAKHHGGHLTILVVGGCDRDRGVFRTHSRPHQNQIQIQVERMSSRRSLFAVYLILLLIIGTVLHRACHVKRTEHHVDLTLLLHYDSLLQHQNNPCRITLFLPSSPPHFFPFPVLSDQSVTFISSLLLTPASNSIGF